MLKRIDLQIKQQIKSTRLAQFKFLDNILYDWILYRIVLDIVIFCCNFIQKEKFLEGFGENLSHF